MKLISLNEWLLVDDTDNLPLVEKQDLEDSIINIINLLNGTPESQELAMTIMDGAIGKKTANEIRRILELKKRVIRNTHGDSTSYPAETYISSRKVGNELIIGIDCKSSVKIPKNLVYRGKLSIKFFDVEGDFICSERNLTSLQNGPDKVTGMFDVSGNKLTSLEGGPTEVGYWYDCGSNKLTDLKGAPAEVNGKFICSNNQLTTLEGGPAKVVSIHCGNNRLTSLKGCPELIEVSADRFFGQCLHCESNQLTSLEGAPETIHGEFDCNSNPTLKSLVGGPKIVDGNYECWKCGIETLDGIPEKVGGAIYLYGNAKRFSRDEIAEICNAKTISV